MAEDPNSYNGSTPLYSYKEVIKEELIHVDNKINILTGIAP